MANATVYRELHPRLVRGYAFDAVSAMERDGGVSPDVPERAEVEAVVSRIARTPLDDGGVAGAARRVRGLCVGEELAGVVHVAGLEVWGQVAQVSAVVAG